MSELRVGILGLGQMGLNHLRVLSELPQVEVVGVFDRDEKRNFNAGKGLEVQSIEELVSKNLDYCVVATPTSFHEEQAIMLIQNGVPTLIEKPIALNLRAGERIANSARANNTIVGVGHIERYNAAVRKAREFLDQDLLGRIYQISTRRQGPNPGRIKDVGVVKDLATHDIDLTAWLTYSNYIHVSAFAGSQSESNNEDLVVVNGLLKNGILVHHLINWISPLKERKTVITGEKGVLVINTLETELTYYENGQSKFFNNDIARFKGVAQGDIHTFAFEKPEALRIEHINFCNRILGNNAEIVTAEEGTETIRIAEAILKSALLKETITL